MAEERVSESALRAAVDMCPLALLIESEGVVVFANRSASDLFGCRSNESLVGLPLRELLPDLPRDFARPDVSAPAAQGTLQTLGGERITVEVMGGTIPLFGGEAPCYFLRRADSAAEQASAPLPSDIMDVFKKLRRALHDMNQPLTIISGKVQLLMLDTDPSHPSYAYLEAVNKAVFQVVNLIKNMGTLIKSVDGTYPKSG